LPLYKQFASSRVFEEIKEENKKIIKSFDINLRNKLVQMNLKLVPYVVDKFFNKLPEISSIREDLINEGNIGLIESIPKFEPDMGFKFSTYGIYYIKQKIYNFLDDNSKTPTIPTHIKTKMSKILEQNPKMSIEDFSNNEELMKENFHLTDKMFQTVKFSFEKKSSISIEEIFDQKNDNPHNKIKNLLSLNGEEKLQQAIFRDEILKIVKKSVNELDPRLKNILLLRYNIEVIK
jgi:RNA polymerase sigma factor (sigma-70 family)